MSGLKLSLQTFHGLRIGAKYSINGILDFIMCSNPGVSDGGSISSFNNKIPRDVGAENPSGIEAIRYKRSLLNGLSCSKANCADERVLMKHSVDFFTGKITLICFCLAIYCA